MYGKFSYPTMRKFNPLKRIVHACVFSENFAQRGYPIVRMYGNARFSWKIHKVMLKMFSRQALYYNLTKW